MQRITRRAFLTSGLAGMALAACSVSAPLRLQRPEVTPGGDQIASPAAGGPATPSSTSADGYLLLAPGVLRTGQTEAITVSLFDGVRPASGLVTVALARNGQTLASATASIAGRGVVSLPVPPLPDGTYDLLLRGPGLQDQTPIQVENGALVFLETDKPIYQPGQTVHFRVIGLDAALRPSAGSATVEVMDAKGIKVFKKTATLDRFGMATVDLPLSREPNLGTWSARATSGKRTIRLDFRVEEYVLPKYAVTIELPRDWALVTEPIAGTITATYSYGKPVRGEVEINAFRYVGTWQRYARVTRPIDGKATFQVPAVQYAAGSPAGGGLATVRLEATVREQATGDAQTTDTLVTIAPAPIRLRIIPESSTFKPSLPFSLLVVAETLDKKPVDTSIALHLTYVDASLAPLAPETHQVTTRRGLALVRLTPPAQATALTAQATAPDASATQTTLRASYSPSGSFVHVESATTGPLKVGDTARFTIHATRSADRFYYEIVSRGTLVLSDVTSTASLAIPLTPAMVPEARLLVYQLLPTGEVAADYLPFKVQGDYPQRVQLSVDRSEVRPGDPLTIGIQTEGPSRVGLVAVDRSVFILAENRLNLQQVFAELETLYLKPRLELHDLQPLQPFSPLTLPGAKDVFQNAGVVILTNRQVPDSARIQPARQAGPEPMEGIRVAAAVRAAAAAPTNAPAAARSAATGAADTPNLAAVQRVRQYFPETWIWSDLTTDAAGRVTQPVTAPDSITTWMLRAVALSPDHGLGIGEAQLKVFQPFFVSVDLPYAAIRGEELPVKVALYNYQDAPQTIEVDLAPAGWFALLDGGHRTVQVDPNGVGEAAFRIRPTGLGVGSLKVTARSPAAADAVIKDLRVEPEGIAREIVENVVLGPGAVRTLELAVPADAVDGSAHALVTLTGNALSQTIHGLEGLLQMPFGCGEQNMITFAPDVFIARYLKATGQLTPEVAARTELLMLTGYQRELVYRRSDGSFSTFGESDPQGSLWLTAFVLKTFAQARDLIAIDDGVLTAARDWIRQRQRPDGSFAPVGFVHHPELLGGLAGPNALTAFVAIALKEAGDDIAAARAIAYLEGALDQISDLYSLATTAYALALARSPRAPAAREKLLARARTRDDELFWEERPPIEPPLPEPLPVAPAIGIAPVGPLERVRPPGIIPPIPRPTAAIETTAYATLALLQLGDLPNAGRAVRWLALQRNATGGFGSTQDTVVALQAMAALATANRSDVDAVVTLLVGADRREVRIASDNADVLQVVELPVGQSVTLESRGKGSVMAQVVRRYHVPVAEATPSSPIQVDVSYSADRVEVDDRITVTATVSFTPPAPAAAGMVVLDVAIPTGFEPVRETIAAAARGEPRIRRWDLAGRKVIFYLEELQPTEPVTIRFQARALYPVRARAVSSQAYAYYQPEWRGESPGRPVVVAEPGAGSLAG